MGFIAAIFNKYPGMEPVDEGSDAAKILAQFDDDDDEASREERAFRMWINSLGVDQHVTDLIAEMRSGLLLLQARAGWGSGAHPTPASLISHIYSSSQVMDTVRPGVVEWEKVVMKPKNVYNKIANCNYAVALAKDPKAFKFSVVGIQGKDLSDGNAKLILAITWQLMRYHGAAAAHLEPRPSARRPCPAPRHRL